VTTWREKQVITLALPLVYTIAGILLVIERVSPAHKTTASKSWYGRAIVINALQFGIFIFFDHLWTKYAGSWSVFNLVGEMHPAASAFLAYFIFTFVVYWWHRLRHHSPFFWRVFHQLHHSPQRIETLTAYYIHPLDMLVDLLISNSIVFLLLGLDLEAAAWYTLFTGTAGFLIHANIHLPRWVGYVFQTPEMHRLHHKSGHHAHNYSDIVWWDMLFGTYCNPKQNIEQCGFSSEQEARVIPMLLGKDLFK